VITINAVPVPASNPGLKYNAAHLWYAIRNDCSFDSIRVEYSEWYNISVLEYVLRPDSNDYTLYVRNSADATCDYVILDNNNKNCATSSCCSNGISYGSAYLWYTIRNNHNINSIEEYSVNGTAYQSSNSFSGLAQGVIYFICQKPADPSCVTISGSTTTIIQYLLLRSDNHECYSAYMCCAIAVLVLPRNQELNIV
jgi:hypothetical protein